MKLGVCLGCKSHHNFKILAEYGYDYVEVNFSELVRMEESEYLEMLSIIKDLNISCEAANCFIPGDIKITGDDVDYQKIAGHMEVGFERAGNIGIKTVVFGSGDARRVAEGFDKEKAYQQLVVFLRDYAAPVAEKYSITIVVEPLEKKACNIIHTVEEGVKLARDCGCDNVKGLGDVYHMYSNNDNISSMAEYKNEIRHAHIAHGISRKFPKQGDGFDYKSFIDALKEAGCERCSIEGSCDDFSVDALEALKYLKLLV